MSSAAAAAADDDEDGRSDDAPPLLPPSTLLRRKEGRKHNRVSRSGYTEIKQRAVSVVNVYTFVYPKTVGRSKHWIPADDGPTVRTCVCTTARGEEALSSSMQSGSSLLQQEGVWLAGFVQRKKQAID